MAILLQFNSKDAHSYDDIASVTQLTSEVLDPALGILLKAKVLLMKPDGEKPGPGKMFHLNYDFKSKKIRVNLNVGTKTEQKQEEADTNKTIEDDRQMVLQVSIHITFFSPSLFRLSPFPFPLLNPPGSPVIVLLSLSRC